MDFPLANSDITLLDADDFDTSVNMFTSSLAIDLDEGLEVAVDASGNGGSGGGGSGNVVCCDFPDDDDGSTNPWTRWDAINGLDVEFWMYHPDREPGEGPHNCYDVSVGPDHPQYDLYVRVLGLINQYFDKLDSDEESTMVDEIKEQLQNAFNAFNAGRYDANGKHWTEFLPGRAELMLTRFAVPYGDIDRSIAAMLGAMGRIRMLHIDG